MEEVEVSVCMTDPCNSPICIRFVACFYANMTSLECFSSAMKKQKLSPKKKMDGEDGRGERKALDFEREFTAVVFVVIHPGRKEEEKKKRYFGVELEGKNTHRIKEISHVMGRGDGSSNKSGLARNEKRTGRKSQPSPATIAR